MSVKARNPKFVWQSAFINSKTPGNAGFIGLLMSTLDNGDGRGFFVSAKTISEMTGLNEKTVRQNIQRLTQSGWIQRTRQGGNRGGRALASEYRLTIPTTDISQPVIRPSQPENLKPQPEPGAHPLDHVSLDPTSLDPSQQRSRVDVANLQCGEEVSGDQYESLSTEERRHFYPSFERDDWWQYMPPEPDGQIGERKIDTRSGSQQRSEHQRTLRDEGLDQWGEPVRKPSPRRRG